MAISRRDNVGKVSSTAWSRVVIAGERDIERPLGAEWSIDDEVCGYAASSRGLGLERWRCWSKPQIRCLSRAENKGTRQTFSSTVTSNSSQVDGPTRACCEQQSKSGELVLSMTTDQRHRSLVLPSISSPSPHSNEPISALRNALDRHYGHTTSIYTTTPLSRVPHHTSLLSILIPGLHRSEFSDIYPVYLYLVAVPRIGQAPRFQQCGGLQPKNARILATLVAYSAERGIVLRTGQKSVAATLIVRNTALSSRDRNGKSHRSRPMSHVWTLWMRITTTTNERGVLDPSKHEDFN